MNVPKDRSGNELKIGDVVELQFDVLETTQGTDWNLKLKVRNVPTGTNAATLHVNSGATLRVVQPVTKSDTEHAA